MNIINQAKNKLKECTLSKESVLDQLIGYHEHAYEHGDAGQRMAADLFFVSLLDITHNELPSITIKP